MVVSLIAASVSVLVVPAPAMPMVSALCTPPAAWHGRPLDTHTHTHARILAKSQRRCERQECTSTHSSQDTVMPWQEVGAPDQKWSWCSQSLNEMGRELARHLEQMEHEHAEFENDVQNALERLQQDVRSRGAKGGTPVSNTRMVRTRTGTGTLIDDEVGGFVAGSIQQILR